MRASVIKLETIAVGTIAVFSAVFLLQTYEYGRRAALFPRLVSLTILLLAGIFLVSRLRRALTRKTAAVREESVRREGVSEGTRAGGVNWLVALSAAAGFCVLIYLVGFGPSTFVYVSAHLYLAGYRRHSVVFLFALAMAAVVIVTAYLFNIQLPEGVLFEKMT
jgi:hypothetical protein